MGEKRFDWTDETDIRTAVFEALGATSVCWDGIDHAGVFQSHTALEIGNELLEFLLDRGVV